MDKLKLAIVDIDGTLIKASSAEKAFFWFLFQKKYMSRINFLRFSWWMVWITISQDLDQAKGRNKTYLTGVTENQLQQWINEYSQSILYSQIDQTLRSRILKLKENGCSIVLLSGSLQILADQLKNYMQADTIIGVKLEMNDSKCTGRISGIYPFGDQKPVALSQYYDTDKIDWAASWSFADRMADLPVLQMVGNPVAVNPEKKLLQYAQKQGWEIYTA